MPGSRRRPGTDQSGKIFRNGCRECQTLAAKRVRKGDRPGMERQAFVPGIALAVFVVTDDRMPEVGQMDADLVFPPGQKVDLQ